MKLCVLLPVGTVQVLWNVVATLPVILPVTVKLPPTVTLPVTPNVVPTVAELLIDTALTVKFPLAVMVVNEPELARPTTLPIGVACNPPNALIVVIAVMDAFDVNAAPVMLPLAVIVCELMVPKPLR